LLWLTVIKGDYGIVVKKTKCVEQLHIITAEAGIHWMIPVILEITTVDENDILYRLLRNNGFCKAVISCSHPSSDRPPYSNGSN
jgi:hypothetical protein